MSAVNDQLNEYFSMQADILASFGAEDVFLEIEDCRHQYWHPMTYDKGIVEEIVYAPERESVVGYFSEGVDAGVYMTECSPSRTYEKRIYEADGFTAVIGDDGSGNTTFMIFDDSKKVS